MRLDASWGRLEGVLGSLRQLGASWGQLTVPWGPDPSNQIIHTYMDGGLDGRAIENAGGEAADMPPDPPI